ncbi:MAG: twin-arginine translocation signal domain-containing protein, partial [Candidatus Hydrogenedentes bacterium]|nr:twin-arginine translocation signal domain-containing protein [Candidatus Hydrogenedentota bacterium]
MTLSRRDFLKLSALVTASAALSSCAPVYRKLAGDLPAVPWTALSANDFLALNRLTFGPRVDERARFVDIGLKAWIEEQLDFESINDLACEIQLSPFKSLKLDANELEGISNQL